MKLTLSVTALTKIAEVVTVLWMSSYMNVTSSYFVLKHDSFIILILQNIKPHNAGLQILFSFRSHSSNWRKCLIKTGCKHCNRRHRRCCVHVYSATKYGKEETFWDYIGQIEGGQEHPHEKKTVKTQLRDWNCNITTTDDDSSNNNNNNNNNNSSSSSNNNNNDNNSKNIL
jgi:hypothetical protein